MKIFSFDIGIASIGWAYIEDDVLKDCGVRIFTKAENPKNGDSLAAPRREARSARRRLARRKGRLNALKKLICKEFGLKLGDYLAPDGELPKAYKTSKETKSPYELRALALEQKLDSKDLARVILHIAKHRGYGNKHAKHDLEAEEKIKEKIKKEDQENTLKAAQEKESATTAGDSKKEQELVLKALYRNEILFKSYQTVGEYFYKGFEENGQRIRNTTNFYHHTMRQEWLKAELRLIFEKQKKFGAKFSEDFENKIIEIAFFQRDLKSFGDKVGECVFFDGEKRAAKDSLSAMEFVALTRIINTLKNLEGKSKNLGIGEVYGEDKIREILNIVLDKGEISYKKLREILSLDEHILFAKDSKLDYTKGVQEAEKAKTAKFIEFENLKAFKKAMNGKSKQKADKKIKKTIEISLTSFDRKELDLIATDIALIKSKENLAKKLEEYPSLTQEQRETLSELNFAKHIDLSLKALEQILPFMRKGLRYDESVKEAGLQEHKKHQQKDNFLSPLKEYEPYLANPVVARALSEYRKVLNALLRKYGQVHKIHIELTHEAKLSAKERKKYEEEQKEHFEMNQRAKELCRQIGIDENNAKNILKAKLFMEQGEFCVYSGKKIKLDDLIESRCVYSGKPISKNHLRDSAMLEVDHIYPYSRSFDDSQNNKVLVFTKENQNKLNKTPFEAFGTDKEKWDRILSLASKLPKPKYRRISNTQFKDKEAGFLARNIVDTGYIARLASQWTKDCLEFLPLSEDEVTIAGEKGSKVHVEVMNGSLTAMLRHYWGLGNKNRDNHLHHAVDAVIIGFTNAGVIKAFSDFRKQKEQNKAKLYAKEIAESEYEKQKAFHKSQVEAFRQMVLDKVDSIFVSKPPRKRARGALHEETFGFIDKLDNYKIKFKSRDKKTNKIKYTVFDYGGENGVQKAIGLGKIRQIGTKIVKNEGMVRVDIFRHKQNGKFYGVPIYAMDFALGILPNKAVVQGKDKEGVIKDWLDMDSSYEFCFSLFKDDLILVQKKEMEKAEWCYFVSFDSTNAQINVEKHNNKFEDLSENEKLLYSNATTKEVAGKSIGIQNLKIFEKHQVSPLGEIQKVESMPRQAISLKSSPKNKKK